VGAGYFSRFHYDAWERIENVQPVAAVDREILRAMETGWNAYDALTVAIEERRPDLLDIVTPPHSHLDLIAQAIEQNVRAIICQKPFCNDLDEARRATRIAERAGVRLIVHENFRFQPWYRQIKAEVASGRIGSLLQMTVRLRTGDGQGTDAYLDRQPYFRTMPRLLVHETAVHFIDVFRFIVGDPQSVYADLRRYNPVIAGEDAGYFIFGYDDGARAMFDGNRLLDHAAENLRLTLGEALVEGTEGTLNVTGDGAVTFRPFGSTKTETVLAPLHYSGFGGDCVYALQKHVVDGLMTATPIENEAAAYLRNLELTELVYRAHERGERIML